MDVKEIPKETQENVNLETIKEAIYNSMADFYGKNDLSWIPCLFDHQLKDRLGVKKGMVHYLHCSGVDKIEDILIQNDIYRNYGDPKALLYTKKLSRGFNLFVTGPEYNNKNLKIICSSPKIEIRDFEEEKILEVINSRVEKLIKGKHQGVNGKINLVDVSIEELKRVILYKIWEMPIESSFDFGEDIKDIQTFCDIYNNFFDYQRKREESFENNANTLIDKILDEKRD